MFCTRPFTHLFLSSGGNVDLCCPGWTDLPAGNVLREDPVQIWHGSRAARLRESVSGGDFRHCIRCPHLPGPRACLVSGPPGDLPLDRIGVLSLNHDPTCNLACPSCRTGPRPTGRLSHRVHASLLASSLLGLVDHINASGDGDPLASPLIWPLLCDLGKAEGPGPSLSLHTNGLLLTEARWKELGTLRNRITHVSISIDASTEGTYRINRGGDWSLLMANLSWLTGLHVPVRISFVVQDDNFMEIEDFIRLGDRFGVEQVILSGLRDWGTHPTGEYRRRAVHLPSHKHHQGFVDIMDRITGLKDERIILIGLSVPPSPSPGHAPTA